MNFLASHSHKTASANKRIILLFLIAVVVLLSSFMPNTNGSGGELPLHNPPKNLDFAGIKTVVIDPGHGGKDPGCIGASSKEKEVCLSIGLKLGGFIEANYPGIKVVYTRKTDVFVELHERAKIANDNKADLFICIHANSGPSHAHGAETYVMGLHRSEDNLKVAQRENASYLLEEDYKTNYKDFDNSPDAIIAMSIMQSAFLDQSLIFASSVQKHFKSMGRTDRGVKQAGFLVLVHTTMPSVLIETGFLTNKEEEKFLSEEKNQEKMAQGIFNAFEDYKKEIDRINQSISGNGGSNETPEKEKPDTNPEKEESKENVTKERQIVFKVQIVTSSTQIDVKPKNFKGLTNVDEYISNGMYKYTVGSVRTLQEAKEIQQGLKEKGYAGAFIVAFENGIRLDLQKAIEATRK